MSASPEELRKYISILENKLNSRNRFIAEIAAAVGEEHPYGADCDPKIIEKVKELAKRPGVTRYAVSAATFLDTDRTGLEPLTPLHRRLPGNKPLCGTEQDMGVFFAEPGCLVTCPECMDLMDMGFGVNSSDQAAVVDSICGVHWHAGNGKTLCGDEPSRVSTGRITVTCPKCLAIKPMYVQVENDADLNSSDPTCSVAVVIEYPMSNPQARERALAAAKNLAAERSCMVIPVGQIDDTATDATSHYAYSDGASLCSEIRRFGTFAAAETVTCAKCLRRAKIAWSLGLSPESAGETDTPAVVEKLK